MGRFDLAELDSSFEEKVYILAEEILNLLRDLHDENRQMIDSKLIAEKMFVNNALKNILTEDTEKTAESTTPDSEVLKDLAETVLERLAELIPPSMINDISNLKDSFRRSNSLQETTEWLDSPVNIVKSYISSLNLKNREMVDFVKQTISYLMETQRRVSGELVSQQDKFKKDRDFENTVLSNTKSIEDDFDENKSLDVIKKTVWSKLEHINTTIKKKSEHDMQRLRETENTLEEMGKRMAEMKKEAHEIRMRSEEMEMEVVRDNLTRLYNRKAYEEKMDDVLANVKRYRIKASLMICDIDHFKKINDTFGHKVGDLALKKIASLLTERLRASDFISRYGGEEFAVILPHTDLDGATHAGEGIRSYIDKSVFSYNGQEIPLTISVGISTFMNDDDKDSVFERADNALYLAKNTGRNCVRTEKDNQATG